MSAEMVERVARAISEAIKYQDGLAHYAYEQRKDDMDAVARAAIEAMREPTDSMTKAGAIRDAELEWLEGMRAVPQVFQAMIDASLAPSQQGDAS